ncbi:MAG TPA: hypothetical protein VM347_32795 [Nonomuraea sp.]|nr:hypothetical protein [Nonomuraea sp.]
MDARAWSRGRPRTGVLVAALLVAGVLIAGGGRTISRADAAPAADVLLIGNSAGTGNGPIQTWRFSTGGAAFASFLPTGATGPNSGLGIAIVGNSLYYTELEAGGVSTSIHIAPFNGGLGGADTRTMANPVRDTAIAALTASEGTLYVLTGYGGSGQPAVSTINLSTNAVAGPITLGSPATASSNGLTRLPNGNLLANTREGSCTYAQFNAATGVATGSSFAVTGASVCNGVETDGDFLYFATDGNSFTKTSLTGSYLSEVAVAANQVQDIALVRVEENGGPTLTELSPVHAWLGLRNSDDQGTQFDLRAELLVNDVLVADGERRCITGLTRNANLAKEAIVEWDSFRPVPVGPDDVISLRLWTRIGTTSTGAKCSGPGGSHNNATGLRLYYDTSARPSRFDVTVSPDPSADLYLRSDGTACGSAQSTGVTMRWLDPTAPAGVLARCRDSAGINFAGGNAWKIIGTWTLPPPA